MLHVAFFGMDLQLLDALSRSSARLCCVYLPPAPYDHLKHPPAYLKFFPRFLYKKKLKTAAVYAGVNQYVRQNHIAVIQAEQVGCRKLKHQLSDFNIDLGVVANFGQRIDQELLSIPTYGFINCHPSLLPKYRGPTPLGHILLNKENRSGVTWHKVSDRMDQGDILAQAAFDIDPGDTVKDLNRKATALAIQLLDPLLAAIDAGQTITVPQDESQATYYPKLTASQKRELRESGKWSS